MKRSILLSLVLIGCTNAHQREQAAAYRCEGLGYTYDSTAAHMCVEYIARYLTEIDNNRQHPGWPEFLCKKDGINSGTDKYDACINEKEIFVTEISKKANQHLADIEKKSEEWTKHYQQEQEKAEKLAQKHQKNAIAKQLVADASECKSYGLNKGTTPFADCMMKIAKDRENKAEQEQAYQLQRQQIQQQAAIQHQQLQAQQEDAQRQRAWEALATAGATMGAGSSPYVLQNLATGVQAGLNNYQGGR